MRVIQRMLAVGLLLIWVLPVSGTAAGSGTDTDAAAINAYLSRFAAVSFSGTEDGTIDRNTRLELIHQILHREHPEQMEQAPLGGGMLYEAVPLEVMSEQSIQLFGSTLDEAQVADYIVTKYDGDVVCSLYRDGVFWFIPGTEDRWTRIAIADCVCKTDRMLEVFFTVYYRKETPDNLDEFYSLTPEEASSREDLQAIGTGKAEIGLRTENGKTAFCLNCWQWSRENVK